MLINHPVKYMQAPDRLSMVFKALADPTRRTVLAMLTKGDVTAGKLAEPFPVSLPAMTKHLKVLEQAGLISRARNAQWRPCHLEADALKEVSGWLESYRQIWDDSLDNLDGYLQTVQKEVSKK